MDSGGGVGGGRLQSGLGKNRPSPTANCRPHDSAPPQSDSCAASRNSSQKEPRTPFSCEELFGPVALLFRAPKTAGATTPCPPNNSGIGGELMVIHVEACPEALRPANGPRSCRARARASSISPTRFSIPI